MSSFTGCPSAKHFAALWGFGLGDSGRVSVSGRGGHQHEVISNQQQEQKNNLIKQQILELEKLQLTTQGDNRLSTLHRRHGEPVTCSSMYGTSGKLDEGFDRQSKELEYFLSNDPQNASQESKGERFPSSISQLDHFSCSSSVGEPFWQYKSLGDNSQFWSQNLQDLGVCEDLGSLDDLNIPDVDVTFRNFEDLFKNDLDLTRALLEEDDMIFSHIEKGMSIDKSVENSHSKTTEDVFAASSISSKNEGKTSKHNAQLLSRSVEYSSYMMMRSASFSRSRLSGESSGSECLDSGNSGGREGESVYKERKKGRMQEKQTQLAPRKAKGEMRKRTKGRFVNVVGYESDAMNVTKSY